MSNESSKDKIDDAKVNEKRGVGKGLYKFKI